MANGHPRQGWYPNPIIFPSNGPWHPPELHNQMPPWPLTGPPEPVQGLWGLGPLPLNQPHRAPVQFPLMEPETNMALIGRFLQLRHPTDPDTLAVLWRLLKIIATYSSWMAVDAPLDQLQPMVIATDCTHRLKMDLLREWQSSEGDIRKQRRGLVDLAAGLTELAGSDILCAPDALDVKALTDTFSKRNIKKLSVAQHERVFVSLARLLGSAFPLHSRMARQRTTLVSYIAACFARGDRTSLLWGNLAVHLALLLCTARV
ncbi:uncharacterized protein LOC62_02G003471 [Vanrija pseudolonga]|uniref:Uncharacterized protein n=1 Tax=Vanrija pseudolonga TaxID=143232 RepID=A0AAF0Y4P9_9TREE|nr:hypothetical protein LOC62_02G003471 [Vanrija pseudolonga]